MTAPSRPEERGWYLMFKDEDGGLEGLTGPYLNRATARFVQRALLHAEKVAVDELVSSPAWLAAPPEGQCIAVFYNSVEVIDLSPAEISALSP